jgi:hypothetical protein
MDAPGIAHAESIDLDSDLAVGPEMGIRNRDQKSGEPEAERQHVDEQHRINQSHASPLPFTVTASNSLTYQTLSTPALLASRQAHENGAISEDVQEW